MSELEQLAWPEVEGTEPLLVCAVGSTEQHGPHLPCGTDTLIATALATALVSARGDALLGPPLSIGASGEHQGFPGTLSSGTEALSRVLVEMVRSARSWAKGVVLVSGHGGNLEALQDAVALSTAEGDRVLVVHCASQGADLHAGRAETSLLLFLSPELVRENGVMAGTPGSMADLEGRLRSDGVLGVSSNGILGDPRGASASEGQARFEEMLTRATNQILEVFH